jgi:peptidoglycan-associated lipoprotein
VLLFLFAGLLLAGCPKKPDVGQAGPAAVGPQAATVTTRPEAPAAKAPETAAAKAPDTPAAKAPETPVSRPPAPREAAVAPRESGAASPGKPLAPAESPVKDVFFDFDRATIRDDQKAALAADIAWLRANPVARVVVEGHCDERGTAEYNLGLGERRAKAVRDALLATGIEADRIRTVSYGKERPFVPGHDESAWRFNRRAHFVKE